MSLRARLVAVIVLTLLLSFAAGAGFAAWWTVRAVNTELAAALAVGRASVAGALAAAGADGVLDAAELRRIVAAYDGDRHLRVRLEDRQGRVLAISHPAAGLMPPRWFLKAISPILAPARIAGGDDVLVIEAEPFNEGLERWAEMRREVGLLGLFCLVAAGLSAATASRSLRPLTDLSEGLARLGGGERDVCVPAAGPPEVAGLARSFNALSAALQAARDQNMRLQMQAELLAEEERADIARDLHDEVGPLLFAITAFTAAIGRLAAASDMGAIPSQLRSIQDATSAIQSRVRDMLGRLSDVTEQPVPLAERLRGLAAFWCRVQPEVDVALRVDDAAACLDGRVAEALFRVAQESVSNAMRHGQPRRVSVTVERLAAKVVLRIADDGKGGEAAAGFGMASMRARLAAIGGRLDVAEDSGWTVTATAPLHGRIRNVPASGGQAAVA